VVALSSGNLLVGFLRRSFKEQKQSSSQQQMLEVGSGNSFRMKEDVSCVSWVGECRGEVGSVVEVVMVIMTFDGGPTGFARRFGTWEIIFVLGGRVLELYTNNRLMVRSICFCATNSAVMLDG